MSIVFTPRITNAGLGVFPLGATGIQFTFTHVAVGTGTGVVTGEETALEQEVARFAIAGGGVNANGKSVSINAFVADHTGLGPQNYDISEVGFIGANAQGDSVLFALYRGSVLVTKHAGISVAMPFALALSALPVEQITVQVNESASTVLALLGQHTAAAHPHSQYKRTADNSERLKVADGVAEDEAVSQGQLGAVADNAYQDVLDLAAAVQLLLDSKLSTNQIATANELANGAAGKIVSAALLVSGFEVIENERGICIKTPFWMGGYWVQMGYGPTDSNDGSEPSGTILFPVPFLYQVKHIGISTRIASTTVSADYWYQWSNAALNSFTYLRQRGDGGWFATESQCSWLAIGK